LADKGSEKIQELRPDNLGVVLEISDLRIGRAVVVREVWQDASQDELAKQYIELAAEACQGFVYIVKPDGGRTMFFPPWAAHLEPLARQYKEYGWRDMETQKRQAENAAQRKDREDKKRRRKLANLSKKRNR
jgi:hypothetical protein